MVIFRARSAAKINLTLDILSRRADGYHELASVVHTIGLWDEIELGLRPGADFFSCNRDDLDGPDNLCLRALRAWRQAAGVEGDAGYGATIRLNKSIPTGAGLGGGSGNAAAVLRLLNHICACQLPETKLQEIAATLGADVPLFLAGGAVLIEGIGEKLTPLSPLSGHVLIVKPETSFATPAVYRAWDHGEFGSQNDTPELLKIWSENDLAAIASRAGNDLERAAAQISDLPAQLIALLRDCGALGARMSGSGSACYGIFARENEARDAGQRLKTELANRVLLGSSQLFVAPLVDSGVQIAQN